MNNQSYALFKYGIIAPYLSKTSKETTARAFSEEAAKKQYFYNGENVSFSAECIRKWIRKYENEGYDSLDTKKRSDHKKSHVMDDDMTLRIAELKTKFPRMTGKAIYEKLIEDNFCEPSDLSDRTVQRYIKQNDFSKISEERERRAYTFEHPNDSWQADTTYGPYIIENGKKYRTYIMIIIDDHSRMIVNAKAYFNDTAKNFELTLKEAIRLCGCPKQLYTDHGSAYDNRQLELICARLTIHLKHPKPYDPAAKGKIERFNRSLKDEWMYNFDWNGVRDLEDLNDRLEKQINKYNNTIHSVTKQRPQEMFYQAVEMKMIAEDILNRSFFHTVNRKANKTGCVSIETHIYEVNHKLIGKMVEYTYDPFDLSYIYHEEERYVLVDRVKNSKAHRAKTNTIDYSKLINKEDEELLEHE